jgi:hypothetical protein
MLGIVDKDTKRMGVIVSAIVRNNVVHGLSLRQDRVLQDDDRLKLHHSGAAAFSSRLFL